MAAGYKPAWSTKTVTSAGTAEALSATTLWVSDLLIQPISTNGGNIYIGDSTINNTGPYIAVTDNWEYRGDDVRGHAKEIDLADVYIDADSNGEGVIFSYTIRRN